MAGHDPHESLLRRALDSLVDPVVVLGAVRDDAGTVVDFTYLDLNEAACRANRRSREDTLGRSVLDLFPSHADLGLLDTYGRVADTGEPAVLNDQPYPDEAGTGEIRYFDIRAARAGDGITLTWRDVTDRHRAQVDMQHLQDQFREFTEQSSDIVYFTGPDRRVRWVSAAIESLLGWRPDDLVGTVMGDLLHPDDRDRTEHRRGQAYAGASAIDPGADALLVRVRTAAGGYRWVRGSGHAVFDDSGAVVGGVGAWHDVDDLVRTRQALESDRQRMQETLDGLMDPVIYFQAVRDDAGTIVDYVFADVNAAACAYNNATREELQGSLLSERYPDMWPMGLFDEYVRVTEGGEGFSFDDWPYGTAEDGTPVLLDLRGVRAPEGVVVTFRDVTDRFRKARDLQASEQRFRQLAENISDVVYFAGPDAAIEWISPSVSRVLGLPAEHLVGMRARDLIHPDDVLRLRTVIAKAYDPDDPRAPDHPITLRGRTADGGYRWLNGTISPVRGVDGRLVGVVGSWNDVTDLILARDAAEEERRRVEATVDTFIDPFVVLAAVRGEDGRIVDFTFTEANRAACEFNRAAREDLLGSRLLDRHPTAGQTELFEAYVRVVETGEPVLWDEWTYPQDVLGGELRQYDVRAVRFGDGVSQTWRDVTERVQARNAIEASEQRYRLLAETASDVVFLADRDGVVQWISPSVSRVLGWPVGALEGTVARSLIHPQDLDRHAGRIDAAHAGRERLGPGDDPGMLLRIRTVDGAYRWMRATATTLRDGDGQVTGLVVGWHDVDALVHANEEAERERARLRAAMESELAPHAFLTAIRDDSGAIVDFEIVDANAPAWEYNLMTREQFVGSRLLDTLPGHRQSPIFAGYVHTVETGEPTVFEGITYDHEPTQASRRYDISAVRVGDGVSLSFRDVTDRYQEAERLAASERRYRMLAENASDIVYWADAHRRIAWISPAVTRVLGWNAGELIGQRVADLVHPDDLARTEPLRAPFYAEADDVDLAPASAMLRARTRDGEYRWMSAMLTRGRDEDGHAFGVVGTWHDIDDLVRAQQAERRTQMSLDEAAAAVLRVDTAGQLRYANPRAVAMLGLTRTVDLPLADLFVDEGADEFQQCLERLRSGAAAHQQARLCVELADGHRVWSDAYLSPIRGEEGEAVREILVQMADVTEEVTSRHALVVSSEHFRMLAENASDVVYETTPDGVIRWVSPSAEQALGWPSGVLVGMKATELVHPADLPAVMPARAQVYESGMPAEMVVRFRTLDGTWRWMSVRARRLVAQDGTVTGAVVGLSDVTEQTLMARRLERSERTFRTAMDEAPQGMALADLHDQITRVNPALARILGQDQTDVVGHRLAEFYLRTDPERPTCAQNLLDSGESQVPAHEHQLLAGDPLPRWVSHSVSLIRDQDGTPSFFVHHVVDVTRAKRREEDLGYRASHDLLTRLLNREGLMDRLEDWLPIAEGSGGVALLFADLDGLKAINDEHGHAAGDAAIIEVARRLERSVRRGDVVARISGDEFVVLLDRMQTPDAAAVVAEKARQGVGGPVVVSGVEIPLTVSIGVASARPGESAADLLARADAALYRAKEGGRNRVAQ